MESSSSPQKGKLEGSGGTEEMQNTTDAVRETRKREQDDDEIERSKSGLGMTKVFFFVLAYIYIPGFFFVLRLMFHFFTEIN